MAEHTPRTVFQSHASLAQIDHIFIQRCGQLNSPITAAKTKNPALRLLRHWVNSTGVLGALTSASSITKVRVTIWAFDLVHATPGLVPVGR